MEVNIMKKPFNISKPICEMSIYELQQLGAYTFELATGVKSPAKLTVLLEGGGNNIWFRVGYCYFYVEEYNGLKTFMTSDKGKCFGEIIV